MVNASNEALMDLSTLRRLKTYVSQLQQTVTKTPIGGPLFLVNPQVVLSTGFTLTVEELIDNPAEGLLVAIDYHEGMPTVNGVPLWEKLEHEPLEYYNLFKGYRNMQTATQRRAIYKLHQVTGKPVSELEVLRGVYNWNIRVQFFDEFNRLERERQLEASQYEIEGKHRNAAEKLFKQSLEYLTSHPELMTPKLALKMLETAVQLERISVGLAPNVGRQVMPATIQVQNTINSDTGTGSVSEVSTVTESKDSKIERLSQVLNIMQTVGVLQEGGEVIDVESKPAE